MDSSQLFSFHDIVLAFFRAKRQIALCFTFFFCLTLYWIVSLPSVYRASVLVLFEGEEKTFLSLDALTQGSSLTNTRIFKSQTDQYLNTQYALLKSRKLLLQVIEANNLDRHVEINTQLAPPSFMQKTKRWLFANQTPDKVANESEHLQKMIDQLSSQLTIEPIKDTKLAKVHFYAKDPDLARRVADAVVEHYIQLSYQKHMDAADDLQKESTARLLELEAKLSASEQALQDYRDKMQLVDLEGVLTLNNEEIHQLTKTLFVAEQSHIHSKSIFNQIQHIKAAKTPDFSELPSVVNDPLIQSLKEQLANQHQQLDGLTSRYGPKHPTLIAAIQKKQSLVDMIERETDKIVQAAIRTYEIDASRVASLTQKIDQAKSKIRDINASQFGLKSKERQVATNRLLYRQMLNTLEESQMAVGMAMQVAQVIDPAHRPSVPVKPNKKLLFLITLVINFMLSAFLCVGLGLLLEWKRANHAVFRDHAFTAKSSV
ncbi:MAG: GumC family protein [Cellvibrionales bacterium]|nr:GumC family protein [Cellvibrionales bacterium]